MLLSTLVAQDIPSGGQAMIAQATINDSGFYSNSTSEGVVASREFVAVTGQDFTTAARVQTLNPNGQFWSSVMDFTSNRAVSDGDVVLLHFWMRAIATTDETGTVTMQAFVEGPGPDYTKSASLQINAISAWQHFFIPFAVDGNYAAGALGFKFGFGNTGRPQTLELGGVEALWYGNSLTTDDLPRTSFQYVGRDANASWRLDAANRINEYRKNRYVVRARDGSGFPIGGEKLRVRLVRHAFQFGTAMVASRIMDANGAANATYREKILELFNSGTLENDTKWPPWDGEWGGGFNQTQTLNALQWTQDNDLVMRGHVLVWPSIRNLPNHLTARVQAADATVPATVMAHFEEIMNATRGYFVDWDVMNEPYDNYDLMQTYGYDLMGEWFKKAAELDAGLGRFVNDYGILSGGGLNTTKQDAYAATIQRIKNDGGPITGIGFQGHFSASPTGIPKVWEILDRYATEFPDLDLRITEFDIGGEDADLQADYLRDFYTVAFSHPNMLGIQAWGFWADAHWRAESAMFSSDWTERPIGTAYRELVHGAWKTNDLRTTAIDGRFAGRGFLGDYVVEDEAGNVLQTFTLTAGQEATVDVVIASDTAPAQLSFVLHPTGTTVPSGSTVRFTAEATGPEPHTIAWFKEGGAQVGTGNDLVLSNVSGSDEGRYYAVATAGGTTVESRRARIGVRGPNAPRSELLANISTRARVQTGLGFMVAGFVVEGSTSKEVVIRAVGPQLGAFGVPGVLADPQIRLFQGVTEIASNDNWSPDLADDFATLGAFALTADTASAALRTTLNSGAYTVEVSGVNDTTGVAIVEVYDAATGDPVQMTNISTRGQIGTGADIMVAGFVIEGSVPQRVLVRGIGPALARFGVTGTVSDPVLRLFESLPDGSARHLRTNYDWSAAANAAELKETTARVGAFSLIPGDGDAALLIDLEPGTYTVELAGANDETGIGLIEVYRVP
ncbi:endo-1,4-beta-xylanase [Actomonas aquatica]|uniref:endo-1,4-beta-xylanase n=1 Tax=Actomonas aquatica TaxID=2866162 RepID=A0ABZ1C690_9BACT|nr:endo-1,4-beta-xylanase [Opitutus sp. WL0086]WRQ86842.1 endo-1,4-beta-xylanase [Opitutus sp. WL0086]